MQLIGTAASNNFRRCWAVALHLRLAVEVKELMPLTPAADSPQFRRLSPTGRVPVLVDGELVLTESHAIMLYFTGLTPNTLWPTDNVERAEVMRWMSWALAHWHGGWQPLQWQRFIKPTFFQGDPDLAETTKAEAIFHREARLLDEHLQGRTWLAGQHLTLADFSVGAGLGYAAASRLPLEPYEHIRAWYARLDRLPAWQQSTPPHG